VGRVKKVYDSPFRSLRPCWTAFLNRLGRHADGLRDLSHDALSEVVTEVVNTLLDTKRLEVDMDNPNRQTVIDKSRALAHELGIAGTPGFIVGNELVPGWLDLKGLKEVTARTRPEK